MKQGAEWGKEQAKDENPTCSYLSHHRDHYLSKPLGRGERGGGLWGVAYKDWAQLSPRGGGCEQFTKLLKFNQKVALEACL